MLQLHKKFYLLEQCIAYTDDKISEIVYALCGLIEENLMGIEGCYCLKLCLL